jgi:small subunit ribosomal protein S16
MSVKIRLQRHGAKKRPFYRVVAADIRSPRDGRFIELLGTYDPMVNPPAIRLHKTRVEYWISVGALPSDTAAWLIKNLNEGNAVDLSAEDADTTAVEARKEAKRAAIEANRVKLAADTAAAAEAAEAARQAKAAAAAAPAAAPAAEETTEEA